MHPTVTTVRNPAVTAAAAAREQAQRRKLESYFPGIQGVRDRTALSPFGDTYTARIGRWNGVLVGLDTRDGEINGYVLCQCCNMYRFHWYVVDLPSLTQDPPTSIDECGTCADLHMTVRFMQADATRATTRLQRALFRFRYDCTPEQALARDPREHPDHAPTGP